MRPYAAPIAVEDGARFRYPARASPQRRPDVAARNEADALALGLVRGREAQAPRDLTDLRFRQLTKRKPSIPHLLLTEPVQEVGLVLVLVASPQKQRLAIRANRAACVVARCHRFAVVQVACLSARSPELAGRVAVDAWAGGRGVGGAAEERGAAAPPAP